MSSWSELLSEANRLANPIEYLDAKRQELLQQISKKTDRNIITYYSAWLTKPNIANLHIVDGEVEVELLVEEIPVCAHLIVPRLLGLVGNGLVDGVVVLGSVVEGLRLVLQRTDVPAVGHEV